MPSVVIPENCEGPPQIAHGGFVSGLLLDGFTGAVQITLRQPTPVGVSLDLRQDGERMLLRHGDTVLAESQAAVLEIDVPPMPSVEQARAAEADSPSRWHERGVHPTCFGCGLARNDDDGLGIAVGACDADGVEQVAAVWTPSTRHAGPDGVVDRRWIVAALDCPGAMAFIARDVHAFLLGRIVYEQFGAVEAGVDHVVSGWQIGVEGKKRFAGTALGTADGKVLAAARAVWFGRD